MISAREEICRQLQELRNKLGHLQHELCSNKFTLRVYDQNNQELRSWTFADYPSEGEIDALLKHWSLEYGPPLRYVVTEEDPTADGPPPASQP